MTCQYTLNGQPCLIADPKHLELHDAGPGLKFTDLGSDQHTKAAA